MGVPFYDALFWGKSPHPAARNLLTKKLKTLRCHIVKARSFYHTWAWFGTGTFDRQTDGHNYDSYSTRLSLRAVARKNCKYNASSIRRNSNTKKCNFFGPPCTARSSTNCHRTGGLDGPLTMGEHRRWVQGWTTESPRVVLVTSFLLRFSNIVRQLNIERTTS